VIKTTIHSTRVTRFLCTEVHERKKKTCHRVGRTHSGQFSTLESFTAKIASSRLPRHWSSDARSVTLLGPISQTQLKGCQTNC